MAKKLIPPQPSLTSKGGSKPIYCNGIEVFPLNFKGEYKGDQFLIFGAITLALKHVAIEE
jgi:hypothetical protein